MEEQARSVIQILIDHQCEVGIDIQNAIAQVWFTEAGLDDHKYGFALAAAGKVGWLKFPGTRPRTFQITQEGWRAVTGAP